MGFSAWHRRLAAGEMEISYGDANTGTKSGVPFFIRRNTERLRYCRDGESWLGQTDSECGSDCLLSMICVPRAQRHLDIGGPDTIGKDLMMICRHEANHQWNNYRSADLHPNITLDLSICWLTEYTRSKMGVKTIFDSEKVIYFVLDSSDPGFYLINAQTIHTHTPTPRV